MSERDLLTEIQEKFKENIKVEARIRKFLYAIVITIGSLSIVAFANTAVIQAKMKIQGEQIDVIKQNYISYDRFFLFNRTYELQLEETQALITDDQEVLEEIQAKYRELRSMIVTKKIVRGK